MTLHYTTLHCIALHFPFHSIPFHSIPFHSIPLHTFIHTYMHPYKRTLYSIALRYVMLRYITDIQTYIHTDIHTNTVCIYIYICEITSRSDGPSSHIAMHAVFCISKLKVSRKAERPMCGPGRGSPYSHW